MAANLLEAQFSQRLWGAIEESCRIGYNPVRFRQMLHDQGAMRTARALIASGEIQDGMREMARLNRRDLILESIMCEPQFGPLFTRDEIAAAEWRLRQI